MCFEFHPYGAGFGQWTERKIWRKIFVTPHLLKFSTLFHFFWFVRSESCCSYDVSKVVKNVCETVETVTGLRIQKQFLVQKVRARLMLMPRNAANRAHPDVTSAITLAKRVKLGSTHLLVPPHAFHRAPLDLVPTPPYRYT